MAASTRRFSTGLPFLDRYLDGGVEAGGLVALTAPPGSQSELLLKQLLSTTRTHFVSTTRPEAEVLEWAHRNTLTEIELDVSTLDAESILADPATITEKIFPESLFVLDTVDVLETASRETYLAFLNQLKRRLREADSVGVLHCLSQESTPKQRPLTLKRADHVWELQVMYLTREIKNRLLVTKSRHGRALTEPIDLRLTDHVRIDTSRKIS